MTASDQRESAVRSYCRDFPAVFAHAKGSRLLDEKGTSYIDFFAGAGALNYGHNHDALKAAVQQYIDDDGIVHSLDLHSEAKERFIETFVEKILTPRNLPHKLQFPGPTGTNAVEAALKLARKATGRTNVIAFTNAFHGMSLGSLSTTTNPSHRRGARVPLGHVTFMPYDGYLGENVDGVECVERMLEPGSGVEPPAAFLVELVQGEGGLRSASFAWLRRLSDLVRKTGSLLIVDDIQAGCGRTGTFFSFEGSGVVPDLVCLSKSLSGLGLPMSLVLIAPEHDVWAPGEHSGTFRGHNLAFVSATAAVEHFWSDDALEHTVREREAQLRTSLQNLKDLLPDGDAEMRGRGLMRGLAFSRPGVAAEVSLAAYRQGLLVETCGVNDEVLKLLPPLNITSADLTEGLERIEAALKESLARQHSETPC